MKVALVLTLRRYTVSPPARGRGLKVSLSLGPPGRFGSPPARGRGLKERDVADRDRWRWVAPCAGAWIEGLLTLARRDSLAGRPLRGGVD